MSDYFLKFPDEATAHSVLYTTTDEITDQDGVVIQEASIKPNFANIDIIGTLYELHPSPVPDDYVPVALDGYHVNVRSIGEDTSAIEPFSILPAFPRRVWG